MNKLYKNLLFALATLAPAIAFNAPVFAQEKETVLLLEIETLVKEIDGCRVMKDLTAPVTFPRNMFNPTHDETRNRNTRDLNSSWRHYVIRKVRHAVSTVYLIADAQKANNYALANLIVAIDNFVKPVAGMQDLVTTIARNGYRQFVCTNMGSLSFERMKANHASLFANFTGIAQVCDINNTHPDGCLIAKPAPEFFDLFLKNNKIDLSKTRVIFIGRTSKNVAGARAAGLEAIKFEDITQLKAALADKGVCLRINS